jgi:hypothetical protein
MADASKSLLFVIKANTEEFSKAIKGITATFMQMSTMVAGAAVGITVAMAAISIKSVNFADQLVDIADSIGMTTDEVQKLAFALRFEGINADKLTSIMKFMSKAMETAADSQAAATEEAKAFNDAFTRLGINLGDFRTLRPAQQIDILFRALANVSNANDRATLTTDIFGKSAMDLMPVIQDWANNQDRLNALLKDFGIPEDKLRDMAGMKNDFETLKIALDYIGMEMTVQLQEALKVILPMMMDLVKQFAQLLKDNPGVLESLGKLAENFLKIAENIAKVAGWISKVNERLKGLPHIGPSMEEILSQPPGLTNPFKGYAQGGIFTRPTLAMVGEVPEAVMPLSSLGSMGVGGGGRGNTEIHIHGDFMGDEMSLRELTRRIENVLRQEGNRSVHGPSKTEYFSQGSHL